MIALLALAAMAKDGIPAEFEYVYVGDGGEVMTLLSRTFFQMMLGEKHIVGGIPWTLANGFDKTLPIGLNETPIGDFAAGWIGAARMDVEEGQAGISKQYGLTATSIGKNWSPVMTAVVPQPTTDADVGECRIKYGKADAQGRVNSLYLTMNNGTGDKKLGEFFYPMTSLDKITVTGKWKSGPLSLDLTDKGGRIADISGSVTYNGVKHIVKGRRFGARCAFGVFSVGYGKSEGKGYVEWTPSDVRAFKIRDQEESKTDKITVFLSLPADLPNGTERVLTRS